MFQQSWQYQTLAEPVPVVIPFPSEWVPTFPDRLRFPQPDHSTAVDVISPLSFAPPEGWSLTNPSYPRTVPVTPGDVADVVPPVYFPPDYGWNQGVYPDTVRGPGRFTIDGWADVLTVESPPTDVYGWDRAIYPNRFPDPKPNHTTPVDVVSPLHFVPPDGWNLTGYPDRLFVPPVQKTDPGFVPSPLHFAPPEGWDLTEYPNAVRLPQRTQVGDSVWFPPPTTILSNLFAYYRLDGDLSDASGNGRTLTSHGETYGVGVLNRGVQTNYGDTSAAPVGTLQNTSVSVAAWVYVQSEYSILPVVVGSIGWDNFHMIVYREFTGGSFSPHIGSLIFSVGSFALPDQQWVHIALTWNFQSQRWIAYVNGVVAGTWTGNPGSAVFGTLTVATDSSGLRGVDEVGLWDRELTAAEVLYLAAPTDPTNPFSADSWYSIYPTKVRLPDVIHLQYDPVPFVYTVPIPGLIVPSVFLAIPGDRAMLALQGGRTYLALSGIRGFLAEASVSALVSGKAQKEADDIVRIPMDFGDIPELQDGATIVTYDVTCADVAITISDKQLDYAYQISALFAGGAAGTFYDIVYTIVLDDADGTTIVRTGQLEVVS